jgi:GT2 family glycosyltransferase
MDNFLKKKETLMKFSIIIPNWNGEKLLKKNLPAVFQSEANQVVVVDNGSTDGSVNLLKNFQLQYPQLKIIFNQKNLGFARAINQGVKTAKNEIVVLLNNDVVPEADFLKPLAKDFKDEEVFAVSLNEPQWSWAKGKWIKGFVEHEIGPKTKKTHLSFWANGGSGAFRKSIWLKLGGLDEMFTPFYWEDIDLSYRAWKRGYKILWEPQSIVHHQHETTISSRFNQKYVDLIAQRNQLLFIWKNITDFKMRSLHKMFLWKKLLTQPGYFKPFLAALSRLFLIFPRWFKELREQKVSDREIFKKFN